MGAFRIDASMMHWVQEGLAQGAVCKGTGLWLSAGWPARNQPPTKLRGTGAWLGVVDQIRTQAVRPNEVGRTEMMEVMATTGTPGMPVAGSVSRAELAGPLVQPRIKNVASWAICRPPCRISHQHGHARLGTAGQMQAV